MSTEKPLTAMGFDYGLRNIGVAYGQSLTKTAQALPPLSARDGIPNWDTIKTLLHEWRPEILIIGLPLNMDGSESELSRRARKFGNRLNGRFSLPIAFMDERLSSFETKQAARAAGHKGNYKNNPIDSDAAKLILEDWLNSQSSD